MFQKYFSGHYDIFCLYPSSEDSIDNIYFWMLYWFLSCSLRSFLRNTCTQTKKSVTSQKAAVTLTSGTRMINGSGLKSSPMTFWFYPQESTTDLLWMTRWEQDVWWKTSPYTLHVAKPNLVEISIFFSLLV